MCRGDVEEAVACIQGGGIVAFPTETYYGLAVDPNCEEAVERVFEIKKRQSNKPLLLLVASSDQLQKVVVDVPKAYLPLMSRYWPGPLTLIFQAKTSVSRRITGGTQTVGVRISSHPVARELVKRTGNPITATSANISGMLPAESAHDVEKVFKGVIDLIIDGGQTRGGLCSTILGFRNRRLVVLRKGQIAMEDVVSNGDFS